jgi:hypothetical protein
MTTTVIPLRRKGKAAPIHAPMTVEAVANLIGPGRTIYAYSVSCGRRLGVVTMTLYASEKCGGADAAYVRGPGVNTLLPIQGLSFRVEYHAAEGAA